MRIKPGDFCASEAMPFQQHHEARTVFDIVEVANSNQALMNVRSNIYVGDRITICSYDTIKNDRRAEVILKGLAVVRVSKITKDSVETVIETKPIRFAPVSREEDLSNDIEELRVKRAFGGVFVVEDNMGNVLDQFKTKSAATEYAERGMKGAA